MVKNTAHFNSTRDLTSDLELFTSEIDDLLTEANTKELNELQDALVHLAAFREAAIRIEAKVMERIELERLADLAERDTYTLETVDGEKVNFDAPSGFDCLGQTTYTYDLYKLEIVGDKIVSARNAHHHRDLSDEELAKCNSEFKLVRG